MAPLFVLRLGERKWNENDRIGKTSRRYSFTPKVLLELKLLMPIYRHWRHAADKGYEFDIKFPCIWHWCWPLHQLDYLVAILIAWYIFCCMVGWCEPILIACGSYSAFFLFFHYHAFKTWKYHIIYYIFSMEFIAYHLTFLSILVLYAK